MRQSPKTNRMGLDPLDDRPLMAGILRLVGWSIRAPFCEELVLAWGYLLVTSFIVLEILKMKESPPVWG